MLAKDLSLFSSKYTVPAGVQVIAWCVGRLTNGSGKVQLSRPFEVNDQGQVEWIRVDRVSYSDGLHPLDFAAGVDPWPAEADGQGKSLSRIDSAGLRQRPRQLAGGGPLPGAGESVGWSGV